MTCTAARTRTLSLKRTHARTAPCAAQQGVRAFAARQGAQDHETYLCTFMFTFMYMARLRGPPRRAHQLGLHMSRCGADWRKGGGGGGGGVTPSLSADGGGGREDKQGIWGEGGEDR